MFQFMTPKTAKGRFHWRLAMGKHLPYWRVRYAFWWWVHNVPVHILIGFFPVSPFFKLHDWTGEKLHGWMPKK